MLLTVSEVREAFNAAHAQEMIVDKYRHRNRRKRRHRSHTNMVAHSFQSQHVMEGKFLGLIDSNAATENTMDSEGNVNLHCSLFKRPVDSLILYENACHIKMLIDILYCCFWINLVFMFILFQLMLFLLF